MQAFPLCLDRPSEFFFKKIFFHQREKKTNPNRRTALTAWASRTERCSVALLSKSTKHIPRQQKVVVVDSFPTDCDGRGPAALHGVSGASGMSWCSRLHFLCCTSIGCCHARFLRERQLLSVIPNCLSLSGHLTSLSREKLKRCVRTPLLDSRVLFPLSCCLVQWYIPYTSDKSEVYARRVDSSALVFSLSSHRHSYIGLVFSSRFIDS